MSLYKNPYYYNYASTSGFHTDFLCEDFGERKNLQG